MNEIKIEELMKVRFDGIANRLGQLTEVKANLLLEHLEWLEGGWETEEILFLKHLIKNGGSDPFKDFDNVPADPDLILFYKNFLKIFQQIILLLYCFNNIKG